MITIKTESNYLPTLEGETPPQDVTTQGKIVIVCGVNPLPHLLDMLEGYPHDLLEVIEVLTSDRGNLPTLSEEFFQDELILNMASALEDIYQEPYDYTVQKSIKYLNPDTCPLPVIKLGYQRTVRPP